MRYFIFIIIMLQVCAGSAQGFRVRHYVPGATTNLSKMIFETTPGNYIAGGIVVDSITGSNQLCIMGLDSQGQKLWVKKYGNNKFQYLNSAFISRAYYKQGNSVYYTTCVLDSVGRYIGVLVKFNLNGDTVWQKIYRDPDPLEDVMPQLVTGSVDGGFLITGFFQNNSNSPYRKCMLIKTDAYGNELWRKKISKTVPNVQDGRNIIQDSATKKIIITGYQYIGDAMSWSPYDNVVILDSLGNVLTRQKYITQVGGMLLDMIQTRDKKIVAVGYIYSGQTQVSYNFMRAFAVKFDLNNPSVPIWKLVLDQVSLINGFNCLTELKNGDLILAGSYDTVQINNLPEHDLVRLFKIKSNGAIIWKKYYDYDFKRTNGDNMLGPRSINVNADGSLIAAVECFNIPAPNPMFFVKWDSTGCDSTIAYCQSQATVSTVGIRESKLINSANVSVYPNPSNGYLNITFSEKNNELEMILHIEDLTGREVKRLILDSQHENYKIQIHDIRNGIYLLSLSRNHEVIYKGKLIKQE